MRKFILELLTLPLIVLMLSSSLSALEQKDKATHILSTTDFIISRDVIIPLNVVSQLFPDIIKEVNVGRNLTAQGNPKATISVTYGNDSGSKRVIISLDQFESSNDALPAYQQAVKKSKIPGFSSISIPTIGQKSFAGSVTKGDETHIGLGVLEGKLIIGITLVGYEVSPMNIANLIILARTESAAIKIAFPD